MPDPSLIMKKELEYHQSVADKWIQRLCSLVKYINSSNPVITVYQSVNDDHTYREDNMGVYESFLRDYPDAVKVLPDLTKKSAKLIEDYISHINKNQNTNKSTHRYEIAFNTNRQPSGIYIRVEIVPLEQ